MPKQELKLSLGKNDVIDGSTYFSFKLLLEKLKELKAQDKIFQGGWEKAEKSSLATKKYLTDTASLCVRLLQMQLGYKRINIEPYSIIHLISCAEELLSIFEKPAKKIKKK